MLAFHVLVGTATLIIPHWESTRTIVLLYLGPEMAMPFASILAAIVGLLLIFWNLLVAKVRRIVGFGNASHGDPEPLDAAADVGESGKGWGDSHHTTRDQNSK